MKISIKILANLLAVAMGLSGVAEAMLRRGDRREGMARVSSPIPQLSRGMRKNQAKFALAAILLALVTDGMIRGDRSLMSRGFDKVGDAAGWLWNGSENGRVADILAHLKRNKGKYGSLAAMVALLAPTLVMSRRRHRSLQYGVSGANPTYETEQPSAGLASSFASAVTAVGDQRAAAQSARLAVPMTSFSATSDVSSVQAPAVRLAYQAPSA